MLPTYQVDSALNAASPSFTLPGSTSDAVGDTIVLIQHSAVAGTTANLLSPIGTAVTTWVLICSDNTAATGGLPRAKVWKGIITDATGTVVTRSGAAGDIRYAALFVFAASAAGINVEMDKFNFTNVTASASPFATAGPMRSNDACMIATYNSGGTSVDFGTPPGMTGMTEIDVGTATFHTFYEHITTGPDTSGGPARTSTASVAVANGLDSGVMVSNGPPVIWDVASGVDAVTRAPATVDATEATTTARTISHVGSFEACGAVLFVIYSDVTATLSSAPTYSDIPMTLREDRQNTSEGHRILIYTLDDQVEFPTGLQTVAIPTHTAAVARYYVVATVSSTLAGYKAKFHTGNGLANQLGANPSVTLTTTVPTLIFGALGSGLAAPTDAQYLNSVQLDATDFGTKMARIVRYHQIAPAGSNVFGFTAASDDYCIAAIALAAEAPVIGPPTVSAGDDLSAGISTLVSITGTDVANGFAITARSWTVISGPAEVSSVLSTAAALSWTPGTVGTYVLRYSATNSAGTSTDDVTVTVSVMVTEHSSTPAVVRNSTAAQTSLTSASFSPPADSVLVALFAMSTLSGGPAQPHTITDSVGGTWVYAGHVDGGAANAFGMATAWVRHLGTAPGAMTVTAARTGTSSAGIQLAVRVLNGASQNPIGSIKTHFTASGTLGGTDTLVTSKAGALVYVLLCSGSNTPVFTPTADTTTIDLFQSSSSLGTTIIGRDVVGTPGSTSYGWTEAPPTSLSTSWLAIEMLPAVTQDEGSKNSPHQM